MASIHPTAVVDPRAEIAADVSIGPFCVIESDVVIETGCRLGSHVVVKTGTRLARIIKWPKAQSSVVRPQHIHAGQQVGRLIIGTGNTIREHVTFHSGLHDDDRTEVGHNNFIMVNVHIAHDCHVGDSNIMANNAMIAGHVDDREPGLHLRCRRVHQFCRIGQLAHGRRDRRISRATSRPTLPWMVCPAKSSA